MFNASTGFPPIAYMSLSELVAAIWPNVYGSSTIGVKKSRVCITAVSSFILYTAASSEVSIPTIRFLSLIFGKRHSTCARASGPNFAAHPEASVICVSFTLSIMSSPSLTA